MDSPVSFALILFLVPAFVSLLTGAGLSESIKSLLPAFFDWRARKFPPSEGYPRLGKIEIRTKEKTSLPRLKKANDLPDDFFADLFGEKTNLFDRESIQAVIKEREESNF